MIWRQAKRFRGGWLVWIGLVTACSGDAKKPTHPGGNGDALDGGSEVDGGDGDGDTSAVTWGVIVSADKVELCAGECTQLRGELPESDGKLSLTWSHGLGDAREVQVCPTETTAYELSIKEEVSGVELGVDRESSDRLTVSVKACAPESPVMCELRYRYDFTNNSNVLNSKQAWVSAVGYGTTIQPTKDEGAVFMGAFGQKIDLGAGPVVSTSGANGLVHKLDKNCKAVWTRTMTPSLKTDVLIPLSITVDAQDAVYATGVGGPLINFDPLAPVSNTFATELVIYKFAADGKEIYRKAYPTWPGGVVLDSEVDTQGNLYVAGIAHAQTDFGGGSLDWTSLSAYRPYVLKLDMQGAHAATFPNVGIHQMARANDRLVYVDTGFTGFDIIGIFLGQYPNHTDPKMTARALPAFSTSWATPLSQDQSYFNMVVGYPDGSSAGIGSRYDSSQSTDTQVVTTQEWLLQSFGADGKQGDDHVFLSVTETTPINVDGGVITAPQIWAHQYISMAALGAQREVALAGTYYGAEWAIDEIKTTLPCEAPPAATDAGVLQIDCQAPFVLKVGADHKLQWARVPDWGEQPQLSGLGVDPAGNVWVQGQAKVPGTLSPTTFQAERDMVVTKLRSAP